MFFPFGAMRSWSDDQKSEAQWISMRAIQNGILKRKPCWICGDVESDGHHQNYDYPFAVEWLCRKHHRERHSRIIRLRKILEKTTELAKLKDCTLIVRFYPSATSGEPYCRLRYTCLNGGQRDIYLSRHFHHEAIWRRIREVSRRGEVTWEPLHLCDPAKLRAPYEEPWAERQRQAAERERKWEEGREKRERYMKWSAKQAWKKYQGKIEGLV